MSRLEELPPDQRAALSLLLYQRKSYAEVASLLRIAERSVHDRAHAALAVLAPRQARALTAARRLEVGDYLLGQQPSVAERLRTRTYLSGSEPARAWASELASQLAPLAGTGLPRIPAPTGAGAEAGAQPLQRVGELSSSSTGRRASVPPPAPARSLPSSRVGGAALLAVIAAAVIVAVILLTGGGSSHSKKSTTTTATTAATKTGPTIDEQITLKPPGAKSKSIGVVYVLSEGAKRAFFIEAQHIPASKGFYYAIWLYNSPTSALPLSKSPAVGSSHRLAGGSSLPSNAGEYHRILLTEETKTHPTHPGHIVLRGAFSVGS
jgi:hypothetical protein